MEGIRPFKRIVDSVNDPSLVRQRLTFLGADGLRSLPSRMSGQSPEPEGAAERRDWRRGGSSMQSGRRGGSRLDSMRGCGPYAR